MTAKGKAPQPRYGLKAPQEKPLLTASVPLESAGGNISPLRDVAIGYVRRGWALIPLCPRSKLPYSELLPLDRTGAPSWKLLAVQPATEAEVHAWFVRDPQCNIAVITGQASGGLVIVDLDSKPAQTLHLPPTATVATARGAHYYFQAERLVPTIKTSWGEIRGEGAYTAVAGSTHPSGLLYEWCDYCSPEEIALVDLPEDLLRAAEAERAGRHHKPPEVSEKSYSFSRLPASDSGGHPQLDDWFRSEDAAVRILRASGVERVKVGKAFPCILPGHEEKRPSAALWRQPDGLFGYHDFHGREGRNWFSLAEVFASVQCGKTVKLGKGETAAWMLRALVEVGLLRAPVTVGAKLPGDAPAIVKDVYGGFKYLLAIRALYDSVQDGAPLSWRFAATWCGRSERHCGQAISWLLAGGYLRQVQTAASGRKLAIFALGTPTEGGRKPCPK